MKNSSYTVSTTARPGQGNQYRGAPNPSHDAPVYAIKITTTDGTTGFIIGPDGDAMFFADKSKATAKLAELKKDDRYSWNCEADVCLFTGWKKG